VRDFRVVKACARDVATLCSDVLAGDGRIEACTKANMGKLSADCVDTFLTAMARARRLRPSLLLSPWRFGIGRRRACKLKNAIMASTVTASSSFHDKHPQWRLSPFATSPMRRNAL
jgi:hypothetical protein